MSSENKHNPPIPGEALRTSLGVHDGVLADIRAVGSLTRHRVDRLVEDFYQWLGKQPEFHQFFGGRPELLAHVKSQQVAYWQDFLVGEVTAAYVEKRRLVGLTHAQIGLGLLVYLQAMQFVSDWLVRAIEAQPSFAQDHPSAAFSVRKLIEFDSAIVVDAYAARTEHLIEEQRARLRGIADVMLAVADGDLGHHVAQMGRDDVLGAAVNQMVSSLRAIALQMARISRGDYSADVRPRGARDELGHALSAMTEALREASAAKEEHLWLSQCQAELSAQVSGNPNLAELSRRVLSYLCRSIGAQVGACYAVEGDQLRLTGTYATVPGDGVPAVWQLGQGLLGEAALEKRAILLSDVPDDCIRIHWGLAQAVPRNVYILPLVHGDTVRGVMELGSLSSFRPRDLELLQRAGATVGLAIEAAQARAHVDELLQATQAQANELQVQQEELRQANEELEEQTQLLEQERQNVEARNREIAAAKRALEQKARELELASRYKSEFLANMSHELRTPLNSLLILSKLLAENQSGNLSDKQVEYAQTVHAAGSELLQLINEVLDLAKIEAGKTSVEIAELPLAELESYVARTFGHLAEEKGLQLEVSRDPSLPASIHTDVRRLHQVVKNLLSNALKFTEHGAIRVRIARPAEGLTTSRPALPADSIALQVEDTGIGIPPAKQHMIFEAFRQLDSGTSRKYGGTGLGLSISKQIAHLLGGDLTVASEPGRGSTFTLCLPRVHPRPASGDAPAQPAAEAPRASEPGAPAAISPVRPGPDLIAPIADDRERIQPHDRVLLIIEDDLKFARILLDMARDRGFKAVVCADGESGLALARQLRPDAVTLDLHLPDMSGWTVFDRLKHAPETRHIPVHIISVDEQRERGIRQGAVTQLRKPVDTDGLRRAFEGIEQFLCRDVKQLLLVEDDLAQRGAIAELIGDRDVVVTGVGSGREALNALDGHTFDCVVLDLGLPDIDGFRLIAAIHSHPAHARTPVIVYTGRELTRDEERQLEQAADAIVIKDVKSPERLLAETALLLHRIETDLPESKRQIIRQVRQRDDVLAGRKVLIVDDDMRNIFAVSSLLERHGMEVAYAEHGRDALSILDREGAQIDAVLMDIMMPEMDGYETMRAIRQRPGLTKMPIIAVTAKAMKEDRKKCLDAGASDYISKPVDADQLLSLLRVWLYAPAPPRAPLDPVR